MKYFLVFLSFLVAIVLLILFLLFTQSGNNMIKPYIEKTIQKKLQKDIDVEAFTLKTNFIDLEVTINKNSKLLINGNFNIFNENVDIEYTIDAKDLKTPYVNIEGLLHVKGKIKGEMSNFQANGTGVIFNSKINFLTHIIEQKVKAIKLNAKNIKIQSILTFFKKPIYSKGMIDINMDIKPKDNKNFIGKSDIIIHYGTLNNALLEKDFNLKPDRIVTYRGTINATVLDEKIHAKTNIFSNIAKIETKNSQYNMKKEVFYSDYIVRIPELSTFQKNLQGSIVLDGNIQKTKEDFNFDVNSKTLGGNLKAVIFNDTLKADLTNLSITKIETMFSQPKRSEGKLNLSIDVQNIKAQNKKGKVVLHIDNGVLHVKKLLKTKQDDKIRYKLTAVSDIVQNNASLKASIISDVLKLNILKGNYAIDDKLFKGTYALHVEDLNNLYFITNRPLKGKLKVNGNFSYDKTLRVDGNSKFLEANTNLTLHNKLLHIKSDDLSLAHVTDMLYYPKVFDSFSTLEADYNLTSKIGKISLNALNGKLIKSELTETIHLASGFDLTSDIYKDSLFRGVINKNKIDFSLVMNGLESYFKIPNGYIDLKTNEIDSEFDIKIKHKDFKGTIKGKLDKPIVELSGSAYIKQKIDKAIEENLPKEWQDTAKGLLELFN